MDGLEGGGSGSLKKKNDQTPASLHMRSVFGALLIYILSGYAKAFRTLLAL